MTVATRAAGQPGEPSGRRSPAGALGWSYRAARRTARRARRRPTPALMAALVFFFGPALAFVTGVRAQPIENRPLADLPSVSSGWNFFAGMERWSVDHLPLRDVAVRANTALSEDFFGEIPDYGNRTGAEPAAPGSAAAPVPGIGAPQVLGLPAGRVAGLVAGSAPQDEDGPSTGSYPRVIQGSAGWLYNGNDAELACEPQVDLDTIFAGWRRLISVVQASGRRVVVTVAPDKSTIVPGQLPPNYLGKRCLGQHKADLWNRLGRGDLGPQYLDLRGPLERQQRADGRPIYWPGDSHWLPLAETIFAQQVVGRLDPAIVAPTDVRDTGPQEKNVDLPTMIGVPRTESAPGWRVKRPGVSSTSKTQKAATPLGHHVSTSTKAALVRQPTTLVGDSFSYQSLRQFVPYFADLTLVHRKRATPEEKITSITGADTVVVEVVERHFASSTSALIDPAFLDSLETALRASPR